MSIVDFNPDSDWVGLRDLQPQNCPYKTFSGCVTRERALAVSLFNVFSREEFKTLIIYECSPMMRGLSLWLKEHCQNYHATGYFPDNPFGIVINGLQNENLEQLTLQDCTVDIWMHLDVLEHLFNPFQALRECYRTLKPGGMVFFTTPIYPNSVKSEQVAYLDDDGALSVLGEPEYHGNPQNPMNRALVTWRFGYDLPLLIQRETGFDCEVRRLQSRALYVMGAMTEVFILSKNVNI